MATDVFNHAPAKLFVNTGSPQFGRPSMGAWVTYGIGSESQTCPASSCCSPARAARAAARSTVGQRLPADRPTRASRSASGGEPILNLASPKGIDARAAATGASTPSAT